VERLIATNATPQKKEAPKKEGPETPPDSPPLDLSDAAVKKFICSVVTPDQINSVLPSEKVNSEQIEDVLADVVDTEKATADEEQQREEPDEKPESKGGELTEVHQMVSRSRWSLHGKFPAKREINREFCSFQASGAILASNRQAYSKACNGIPYATEQGIFKRVSGKIFQGTGNFHPKCFDFEF